MADNRAFAKIDVGWHMNRKWYTVERDLRLAMPDAMPDALLHALHQAMLAHMVSILYCAQQRTDGLFPVAAIKQYGRITNEDSITALFDIGLWVNHPGGMAEVRDYLEHQPSADSLETASEKARKAAAARWNKHASSNAKRNASSNASSNAEKSREEKSREEVKRGGAAKRGTRIAPDYMPSPRSVELVSKDYPEYDTRAEHPNFVDYWLGVSGAKGVKLDWEATWRKWMRTNAREARERQSRGYRNQNQIMADMHTQAAHRDTLRDDSPLRLIQGGTQ